MTQSQTFIPDGLAWNNYMGTRNLTIVVKDKETKIAQYGQWDGYPSGNGAKILKFLKEVDLKKFKKDIEKVSFFTDLESEYIDKDTEWKTKYPQLSRDVGADILLMVNGQELKVINQEDFAGDSLMNEWTYVIDLDQDQLEVYTGFNEKKVPKSERFAKYNDAKKDYDEDRISKKYFPIKLKKIYKLNELPTESQFIAECDPPEEE